MKWSELKIKIDAMTDSQLDSDVTVFLDETDEFIRADHFELCNDNEEDRLDDGHPYLVIL